MKKVSWFSLNNTDLSGESWFSQGYQNAAVSSILALQEKGVGVFYNREELPFHINFCPPVYYQIHNNCGEAVHGLILACLGAKIYRAAIDID